MERRGFLKGLLAIPATISGMKLAESSKKPIFRESWGLDKWGGATHSIIRTDLPYRVRDKVYRDARVYLGAAVKSRQAVGWAGNGFVAPFSNGEFAGITTHAAKSGEIVKLQIYGRM